MISILNASFWLTSGMEAKTAYLTWSYWADPFKRRDFFDLLD
jgi:hypothetical protein